MLKMWTLGVGSLEEVDNDLLTKVIIVIKV